MSSGEDSCAAEGTERAFFQPSEPTFQYTCHFFYLGGEAWRGSSLPLFII
jgi:hypothetical protein